MKIENGQIHFGLLREANPKRFDAGLGDSQTVSMPEAALPASQANAPAEFKKLSLLEFASEMKELGSRASETIAQPIA